MLDRQLNRRQYLVAVSATSIAALSSVRAQSASAVLPTVNMEMVVLAAQLDPVKVGTGSTAGAGPSVTVVEDALAAQGLLSRAYVDGHFGTATRSAYATWQRSLGYSGLDATGLPGRSSLIALGSGGFLVAKVITAGARTTYQGYPVNSRTVAMLSEAFRLADVVPRLRQGSYSPGADATSAGTHDGGGAVDLDAARLTRPQRVAVVTSLRRVGFAAWLRTPAQGSWPLHIRGIAANDTDLSLAAQQQVGEYYLGRDGLANNGPDDGPKVTRTTWEAYIRHQLG